MSDRLIKRLKRERKRRAKRLPITMDRGKPRIIDEKALISEDGDFGLGLVVVLENVNPLRVSEKPPRENISCHTLQSRNY